MAAAVLHQREGYAEIRTVAASHVPYSETFGLRELEGEVGPLAPEQDARRQEIEAELAGIEAAAREAEAKLAETWIGNRSLLQLSRL